MLIEQGTTPTINIVCNLLSSAVNPPISYSYSRTGDNGVFNTGSGTITNNRLTTFSYYYATVTLTSTDTANLGQLIIIALDMSGNMMGWWEANVVSYNPTIEGGDITPVLSGTASAGASTTITLAAALGTNNILDGLRIDLTGGTGVGQSRAIIASNHTTGVVTVDRPWIVDPDNTTTYNVMPANCPALDSNLGVALATTQPNYNIPNEILDDSDVETGITIRQGLKVMLAALAGKKYVTPPTGEVIFRDTNDTLNRIDAITDANGQRLTITLDLS